MKEKTTQKNMADNSKKHGMGSGGLVRKYINVVILPLIVLTLTITFASSKILTGIMYRQVMENMQNVDSLMTAFMDDTYPGDYVLNHVKDSNGKEVYSLLKGKTVISGENCRLPEQIKKSMGLDVSIIYYDTRMYSTLKDSNGNSSVGTAINSRVLNTVYEKQIPQFYENVEVNGQSYLVYYQPIRNSNGTFVGLYGFAESTAQVSKAVRRAMIPIMIIVVLAMLLVVFISVVFTRNFLVALDRLMDFLVRVEHGSMNEQMDTKVLGRKDELGEASRAAVSMQKTLGHLIEYDELTGIYNRRYANQRFSKIIISAVQSGVGFSACIGDIDFFKKVNDTYGHECGDAVLVRVAETLKRNMAGHGFAARWGGEEFLLVFDRENAADARNVIEKIIYEIRREEVSFGGQTVSVTMSFGITEGNTELNADQLLMKADDNLYYSKTHGRNKVTGDESGL
jgi:diguanylate cyclase (GGDEF)-like protein